MTDKIEQELESQVAAVIKFALITDKRIKEIEKKTSSDRTMQILIST